MAWVHLVLFEAWNITRFVFVTNKRREIAGASELITYLDRRWVYEALGRVFPGFAEEWRVEERPAELLAAGAGSVKVLVRDRESAVRLVTEVTTAVLREAPGLDVCGVVSEPFDWAADGQLAEAVRQVHRDFAAVRTSRPGPDARFLRLPVVDECATTGLPAAVLVAQPDGGVEPRSAESLAKWVAYGKRDEGDGLARLAALAGTTPQALGRVVRYLSDEAEWVGVVYVDGNGLGQVFQHFERCVPDGTNRSYADTLRGFTTGLQECAEDAFRAAVAELSGPPTEPDGPGGPDGRDRVVPVLPLILGGDDLIAQCDGAVALPFARAYLRAFERLTGERPEITEALRRGGLAPRLSASAGVAIVKPHFPFEAGARLAYALLREAKQVKAQVAGPCAGLAFHVLYDSSDADLARLRGQATLGDGTRLVAQPYVVSDVPADEGWMRGRHWHDLVRRVAALRAVDEDGERLLPAAQLHDLRAGLFLGREVADARFANLVSRYRGRGLEALAGTGDSLFWAEPSGRYVTGLLDALDAADFVSAGAGS
nr:hypothetical protein [Carbonactinospora thermoautotrophica]